MEFQNQFDLLLEGLAYFGRRAAGKDWQYMEQRVMRQKIPPSPVLVQILDQLKALTGALDQVTEIEESELQTLFGNLEGFPYNTIGSSSRAFFLFYPLLAQYLEDPGAFARQVAALDSEQVAWGIASIFEDDLPPSRRLDLREFTALVLGLAAPDSTKVALLELSQNYAQVSLRAMNHLAPVLQYLREHQSLLADAAQSFAQYCANVSQADFFALFSRMRPDHHTAYTIRPFVLGADTNLTFDLAPGRVRFYCGILRRELTDLVSGRTSTQDQVCELYRLLGDPTRFDILCYLCGHNAYVQELANRFGLSRNTIHHHMNKLVECGLVQCTVNGNRMYYSLDPETIQLFLQRQAVLFQKV